MAPMMIVSWMSCLVLIVINNAAVVSAQEETLLEGFKKPANLLDIAGTDWMFINEFSNERKEAGNLSLFNTMTEERADFPPLLEADELSYFADSSCTPNELDEISPHGVDGRDIGGGKWEIAVVNHFRYESIEFYLLDVSTSEPTLTSMGCTVLSRGQDAHNAVSYSPDGKYLAISLYYQTFYGILGTLNYMISFFRGQVLPGGDGGLKIMSEGGSVELVKKGLNGANGVIFEDKNKVYVAENPRGTIVAIDPETGKAEVVLELPFPDNMSREEDALLVTRIDTPFAKVVYCSFQSIVFEEFCELEFSVIRLFYDSDESEVVYSSAVEWQVTHAVIKNNELFVGNYETDYMLRVRGF